MFIIIDLLLLFGFMVIDLLLSIGFIVIDFCSCMFNGNRPFVAAVCMVTGLL